MSLTGSDSNAYCYDEDDKARLKTLFHITLTYIAIFVDSYAFIIYLMYSSWSIYSLY